MNEQWINDTCMLFQNTFKDIDTGTVRNILTLALMDCEITKYTKAVTVYKGEPNEQIIKAFVVAKRVAGASDRITFHTKHGKEVEFTKVIRCKDCKWYEFDVSHRCGYTGLNGYIAEDDFCSKAEPKVKK